MTGLKTKVAIVTGASAGIGRAYALALAEAGATVVAAARRLGSSEAEPEAPNTLASLVKEGHSLTGRIYAQPCDMEREDDIVRLVDQTAANFGRIDVLINNAAMLGRLDTWDISSEAWDRFMITNVRGPYIAIRQAARYMKQQRSGSIINISAAGASAKVHYPQTLPYSVSKAALDRLTCFMAVELRPFGIAVNSLSPGVILSETVLKLNPDAARAGTHKPATSEVLGPALLYLAQQNADTLTGAILHTEEFQKSWPAR